MIWSDYNPTGVMSVDAESSQNGITYNLAGQRVSASAKGIVIVNGKKFMK